MTVHMCRQLKVGQIGSYANLYALGCFMTGVLGYTLQSANQNGPTTFLPYIIAQGLQAAIYTSSSITHSAYVDIPFSDITGSFNTSTQYASYILAIKSNNHPLSNSGLYTIITSSLPAGDSYPTTGTLTFAIDYRSDSTPPVESSLQWSLFSPFAPTGDLSTVVDNPPTNFGNGGTGYQTSGSSTSLRAIYKSPHATAWQLRLCLESYGDRGPGQPLNGICFTATPGFSGSNGDFPNVSNTIAGDAQHLHGPMWFNTTSSLYDGTQPGLDPQTIGGGQVASGINWGFWAWGDDTTGTIVMVNSSSNNGAAGGWMAFGLPEDETMPIAPLPIQRLFTFGNLSQLLGQGINWDTDTITANIGCGGMAMSWDPRNGPISCVPAAWSLLCRDNGSLQTPQFDPHAVDTPFLQATELLPVDLFAGTLTNWYNGVSNPPVLNIEPRRLGRFPFARFGRANQSNYAMPSTGSAWFHVKNGVYLPWDTAVLPLNTNVP